MKAIGKNIGGEEIEFSISNNYVYCYNNQLTELHIPNGVKKVYCSYNQLSELVLPNGVERVYCGYNPIAELTLPNSIIYAILPLNCNVLNIDEFKNRTDITIRFV